VKWWCPRKLRPILLRLFGAAVGPRVFIRHRVRVLWPWKLSIGADSWIGEDAWILNLEPVTVGNNVCVSQGVFLCTGSHNYHSDTFEYDNAPITVKDEVWIAAQSTLHRGVTVEYAAVIGARALVTKDVPAEVRVPAGGRW